MGEVGVEGEIVVATTEDGRRRKSRNVESSFLERGELLVAREFVAFSDDDHRRVVVCGRSRVGGTLLEEERRFGVEGFFRAEEGGSRVNGVELIVEGVGTLPA